MHHLERVTRWLSLAVLAGLLAQLLPPAGSGTPAAQAATRSETAVLSNATGGDGRAGAHARPLGGLLVELQQALEAWQAASGEQAKTLATLRVRHAWAALESSSRRARAQLAAQPWSTTQSGDANGAQRSSVLAEYDRQWMLLEQGYRMLDRELGRTNTAAGSGAGSLLATIDKAQAAAAPPAPSLDQLPHGPVSPSAPITRRRALDAASRAALQEPAARSVARQPAPAGPEDLLPTVDAPLAPDIVALAGRLNGNPLRIYEYVRNNIAYEPYYGSRKGALLTLWERSGNDVDTASLLLALLRASRVPARYVQGTVVVDAARARNWVGNAPDLETTADIFSKGGVPVTITNDGFLVKPHVWVTAQVVYRSYVPAVAGRQTGSRAVEPSSTATQPTALSAWTDLDASFKQFDYREPADLRSITGFDAGRWVDEMRAVTTVDDQQRSILDLPRIADASRPEDDDADRALADAQAEDAIARTAAYLKANPQLSNADVLGGAFIRPEIGNSLPQQLPLAVAADKPIVELRELPATLRDSMLVKLLNADGTEVFSYQASLPQLADRRITVSYEAATPTDQRIIDQNGGTLLTTPPVVNLVPVLRVDGAEQARGAAIRMATRQTRSITLNSAAGQSATVENSVRAGETFAVGLAYGRTSARSIEANQQRLAAAREALPKDANGDPDPNAPGNMAEPVVGAMLHLTLQSYFNQVDTVNEVLARGRELRWFRGLSVGIASQTLAFDCLFSACFNTSGGGVLLDVQRNSLAATSLRKQAADERAFFLATGRFSSALENTIFENAGHAAVSTIRLHELALERGIPVHRIDSSNKAQVLPKLTLSSSVERLISDAVDGGRIVTVSQDDLVAGDWSGVGWIVSDPASGASAYLISGGLNGALDTANGGAIWETLRAIAAYALLGLNIGLDLWGIWSGISLLLIPTPLTIGLGLALIAANLVALGFDIADLTDLVSGDKAASQYLGEQLTGLLIEAILKRIGIAAAADIVRRIGPDAVNRVVRQMDNLTGGAIRRLMGACASLALVAAVAAPPVEAQALCPGLSPDEVVNYAQRVGGVRNWQTLADLATMIDGRGIQNFSGAAAVRRLLEHPDINANPSRIQAVARAIIDAPKVDGYNNLLQSAVSSLGGSFQFQRAIANQAVGATVEAYERLVTTNYRRFVRYNPTTGLPEFETGTTTDPLSGDVVLQGNIYLETKWGPSPTTDRRLWNQIQKAADALQRGLISEYRIESAVPLDPAYQRYINTLPAAIANRIKILDNLRSPF